MNKFLSTHPVQIFLLRIRRRLLFFSACVSMARACCFGAVLDNILDFIHE
jgi:hypothetical protein